MNKLRFYLTYFFLGFFGLMLVYFASVYFGFLAIPFQSALTVAAITALVFFIGTLAIYPGLKKASEHMPTYFLVMTTLEIMSFLAVVSALFLTQKMHARSMGFHFLALFMGSLVIQSLLLIRTQQEEK